MSKMERLVKKYLSSKCSEKELRKIKSYIDKDISSLYPKALQEKLIDNGVDWLEIRKIPFTIRHSIYGIFKELTEEEREAYKTELNKLYRSDNL